MINRLKPVQVLKATSIGVMVAVHNRKSVKAVVLLKDGGVLPEGVSFVGQAAYHIRRDRDWELTKSQSETIEDLCKQGWRLMRPERPTDRPDIQH